MIKYRIALATVLLTLAGRSAVAESQYTYEFTTWKEQDWKTVESDDGAVYKVAMSHLERMPTGVLAYVYIDEGDELINFRNTRRIIFDCRTRYMDITRGSERSEGWLYAAPKSVAGRIQKMVCDPSVKYWQNPSYSH